MGTITITMNTAELRAETRDAIVAKLRKLAEEVRRINRPRPRS